MIHRGGCLVDEKKLSLSRVKILNSTTWSINIFWVIWNLYGVSGLNVPKMSTFIVILTKTKHIFLYATTNIWYNSAKPYTIHQRGHLVEKKLEQGEMGKIWSINPLLAVTHKTDFFQLFTLLL